MKNKEMEKQIAEGYALDVRAEGREIGAGVFELKRFVEGKDYCDSLRERWISSIGKSVWNGLIYAASDARYEQHPNYETLYTR